VVECQLPKLDVAGSTPVSRSKINNLQAVQNHTLHRPSIKNHEAFFRVRTSFVKTESSSCFAAVARSFILDLV